MADREIVEVLMLMRFEKREILLPAGVARIENDEAGRQVAALRLSLLDRRLFLPLWDLLVLAGIDLKGPFRRLASPIIQGRSPAS